MTTKMTKMTITIRANHQNDEKPITIPRIVTIIGSVRENSVKFLPFTGSGSGFASGSGSGAKKGGGDSARSTGGGAIFSSGGGGGGGALGTRSTFGREG